MKCRCIAPARAEVASIFLGEIKNDVVSGKTNVFICSYGKNCVESERKMAGDGKCAKNIWREMWSAPKILYWSWWRCEVRQKYSIGVGVSNY